MPNSLAAGTLADSAIIWAATTSSALRPSLAVRVDGPSAIRLPIRRRNTLTETSSQPVAHGARIEHCLRSGERFADDNSQRRLGVETL